jgi:hypothetical protein
MGSRVSQVGVAPGVLNRRVDATATRRSPVTAPTTTGFADLARRLAVASRAAGLAAPAFRSPPRRADALRTIRRLPGGTVVSVRLRGRALPDVAADMVEGVVVANRLSGEAATRVRDTLRAALHGAVDGRHDSAAA